jgi:hypothetical protein
MPAMIADCGLPAAMSFPGEPQLAEEPNGLPESVVTPLRTAAAAHGAGAPGGSAGGFGGCKASRSLALLAG